MSTILNHRLSKLGNPIQRAARKAAAIVGRGSVYVQNALIFDAAEKARRRHVGDTWVNPRKDFVSKK